MSLGNIADVGGSHRQGGRVEVSPMLPPAQLFSAMGGGGSDLPSPSSSLLPLSTGQYKQMQRQQYQQGAQVRQAQEHAMVSYGASHY
jgi:hypothetical protein